MKRNLKINDVFTVSSKNKTYLVVKTEMTGGGAVCGPHDVYPDGHLVRGIAIDVNTLKTNPRKPIEFYQSGYFNGKIAPKDVTLVGTAKTELVISGIKKA